MALISCAAKKRPGQACRPYPKLNDAGLDATYCARPSISGRCSLILENRKGSNTSGSGYRDSSIVMACVGIPIVVFAGMVKPEESVYG